MNSASRTTLLMMVLAIASVAVSMYFYPWEEVATTDAEIGQPLFEEYRAVDVRGVDILRYNSDRQVLDRLKLVRRGERWVVPSKQDFEASESSRVAVAVNSLNDKTIYEVISENQEDHIKFGVVDPSDSSNSKNVSSLGRKLTLTDRNNKTIADIIVGSRVKSSPEKRYVRVPGKPRVYVVDFDQLSMAGMMTEFAGWVSPNLLNMKTRQDDDGRQLRGIEIDSYRIAPDDPTMTKKHTYQAALVPLNGKLEVKSLRVPYEEQGKTWKERPTTPKQQRMLSAAVVRLVEIVVDDVVRKEPALAAALRDPSSEVDPELFASLASKGFIKKGLKPSGWEFDSLNGQVRVATTEGVVSTVSIGPVGNANSAGGGKLNYVLMINSGVDYDFLQEPQRPEGLANDESDANKAFLRLVEAWKARVDIASRVADELNAMHGEWYYLVSDSLVNAMRPDIPLASLVAEDAGAESEGSEPDSADGAEQEASPEQPAESQDPDENRE